MCSAPDSPACGAPWQPPEDGGAQLEHFRRDLDAYEAGADDKRAVPVGRRRKRRQGGDVLVEPPGRFKRVGAEAKRLKEAINRQRTCPPRSRDRREILDAAAPVVQAAPKILTRGFPLALPALDQGITGRGPG